MKTNIKGLLQPYSGEPRDFVLDFGKHRGVALQNVPVHYLRWVSDCVTNRPEVVSIVRGYLNGLSQSQKNLVRVSKLSMREKISTLSGLSGLQPRRPQSPRSEREEGDIHFESYPFPVFQHPAMDITYGGTPLKDMRLRELEDLLQRCPDPQLRDFVACRFCNLYQYFVYDNYTKANRLDISKLNAEEAYRFQEVMDVCRTVQSILDTITDPELCKDVLRAPRFASLFKMTLPDAA
jgi:hypothetical protein